MTERHDDPVKLFYPGLLKDNSAVLQRLRNFRGKTAAMHPLRRVSFLTFRTKSV